jgi:hypothetical protein
MFAQMCILHQNKKVNQVALLFEHGEEAESERVLHLFQYAARSYQYREIEKEKEGGCRLH